MLINAILGVILSIASILLFQEKPPKAPSATANKRLEDPK